MGEKDKDVLGLFTFFVNRRKRHHPVSVPEQVVDTFDQPTGRGLSTLHRDSRNSTQTRQLVLAAKDHTFDDVTGQVGAPYGSDLTLLETAQLGFPVLETLFEHQLGVGDKFPSNVPTQYLRWNTLLNKL